MFSDEEYEKEEARREAEHDSISGYLDQTNRFNDEVNRLKYLFKDIDENKKKLVYSTVDDVAFMTVTMQDLRDKIIREGTTVTYKNGENQYGKKQSPDAQLYLQLSQKLTQATKVLIDCLPKKDTVKIVDDGFDSFVDEREDV